MVIVHDTDKNKILDKQKKVELIKYNNGVKNIYDGIAIYLPKRIYEGEYIFSDILMAKNKHAISNVAFATSSFVVSIGGKGNTTLETIKKIKELKNKQLLTDDDMNKVLNASEVKGSGFLYV